MMNPTEPTRGRFWVDGHVDLPLQLLRRDGGVGFKDLSEGPFTLEKAQKVGLCLFISALYCEDRFNGRDSWNHLQTLVDATIQTLDPLTLIHSKAGLETLLKTDTAVGTLFLLENSDALAEDPSRMTELKQRGVHLLGLTHRGRNRLADGNDVRHPEGLTRQGRDVVHLLGEHHMLLDVAHLHPYSFWQTLDAYEGCVVSSHTGIRTVADLPRNLDMDQIREIIERDGLVGITVNPEMLSEEGVGSLDLVFAHLDSVVQRFGPGSAAVGSDFLGFQGTTRGLEDIGRLPNLEEIMFRHGYGESGVRMIMGANWMRVLEPLLKAK